MFFCVDADDKHFTTVTGDPSTVARIKKATMLGRRKATQGTLGLKEPTRPDAFPICREGWPDEWLPDAEID
jgi:hypothetical protein